MNKGGMLALSLTCAALLSACGGSSGGDTDFPEAYIQFYNGSANSASTSLYLDDVLVGTSSYGDATTLTTIDSGEYEAEISWLNSDGQENVLYTDTQNFSSGEKHLVMLGDDFDQPSINTYSFTREEMENHFRLFTINLAEQSQSFDLYMAEGGTPFESANFLSNVTADGLSEMTYWAGDTDSEDFDEGDYVFYLTLPGDDEVIFSSADIDFIFDTEYVLVILETSGAIAGQLTLDLIINSTSIQSFSDLDASSQFRIYNSMDDDAGVEVTLDDSDGVLNEVSLAANSFSEFQTVDFGDYRLSATPGNSELVGFNNKLLTLNQGESKAVLIYQDAEQQLTSIAFTESVLPQQVEHEVNVANLVDDFNDVDVFFVRQDETIDSAEFSLTGLDFAEVNAITLPDGFYQIVAIYDDESGNEVLLDRSDLLPINEAVNYIVTIEESETSPTGFRLALLH